MDRQQFDVIIRKVFKSLTPKQVQILEYDDGSAKVLIVSPAFDGLRLKKRIDTVWHLIENESPDLIDQVLMSFELYSIAEFKSIMDKFESSKASDSSSGFAAGPTT